MAAASPTRRLRHLLRALLPAGNLPPAPLGGQAAADVEGPSMLSGGGEAAAALTCRRALGSAMSVPHNTAVLGSSGCYSARSFLPPVTARIGLMSQGSVP